MYMPIRGLALLLVCTTSGIASAEPASNSGEAWLDKFDEPVPEALQPRSSQLEFFETRPEGPVPHSDNRLRITTSSLDTGWVELEQCHGDLEAFPRAEIVYQYHDMRDLKLVSSHGVTRAWVKGQSIQMVGAERGAQVCISAQTRTLKHNADGSYTLKNGPFHRRFLDGYFPLHVSVEVSYPADRIRFHGIHPAPQEGFSVDANGGTVAVDALFSGNLVIRMKFDPTK